MKFNIPMDVIPSNIQHQWCNAVNILKGSSYGFQELLFNEIENYKKNDCSAEDLSDVVDELVENLTMVNLNLIQVSKWLKEHKEEL